MKVLWILTLFFSISLHAQSLIGLIDRSNDNHPSLAEGHNMSISGLVRGSGIQKTTGTAQDFNSYGWDESSLSDAVVSNDYIAFSLTALTNRIIDLAEMTIIIDRSPSGPNHYEIQYSLDGFNTSFSLFNQHHITSSTPQTYVIDLQSIPTLSVGQFISIRLYAWGATSPTGTLDIEGFIPTYQSDGWTPSVAIGQDPGIAILGCTSAIPVSNPNIWPQSISSVKLDWVNPSCFSQIMIIAKDGSIPTFDPSIQNCNGSNGDCVSSDFTANSIFSDPNSSTNLPLDEFCIYKGTGTSVTVTNLINGHNYYFKMYTYLNPWSDYVLSPILYASMLPVEFASFYSKQELLSNRISWSTNRETENDYFELEKSKDGINFFTLNRIDGGGTTNKNIEYTSIDNSPYDQTYYRIKQVDFDGFSSYSKIISQTSINIKLHIIEYPEYTEVVPINDDLYQYSIVNTFGTKIISGEFQHILRIKKSSIPPGNYFIQIQSPYHEEFLKWYNLPYF